MWLFLVLLLVLLLLAGVRHAYLWLFAQRSPNPFSKDVKRPPAPLVTDKEARKRVLKQGQQDQGSVLRSGGLASWAGLSFPVVKCWGDFLARGARRRCAVMILPLQAQELLPEGLSLSWQCQRIIMASVARPVTFTPFGFLTPAFPVRACPIARGNYFCRPRDWTG